MPLRRLSPALALCAAALTAPATAGAEPTVAPDTSRYQLDSLFRITAHRPRLSDHFDAIPLYGPSAASDACEAPGEGTEASQPYCQYTTTVDRDADLEVDFKREDLVKFTGSINVRARILRATPVELPVDNYVIITDEALATRNRSTVASARSLVLSDTLLTAFDTLFVRYREYRADWDVLTKAAAAVIDENPPASDVVRELRDAAVAFRDLRTMLGAAHAKMQGALAMTGDLGRLLADKQALTLGVRTTHSALVEAMAEAGKALRDDLDEAVAALDGCLAKSGAGCGGEARTLADKVKSSSSPTQRDPATGSRGKGATMSETFEKLYGSFQALADIADTVSRVDAISRVAPARVHLADADLVHGDRLEVIITSTLTRADQRRVAGADGPAAAADGAEMTTFVVRRVFRVADVGFSYSVNPQFALVTPDLDTQVTPTPGIAVEFRYRYNQEWTDWVVPSLSIVLHALDTDVSTAAEPPPGLTDSMTLGLGIGTGWLNGLIHLGAGARLDGSRDTYLFAAFDFANGWGVFQQANTGAP